MLDTYRAILSKVFEDRQQRNPRYSLRAFARDLSVNIATVSEVLNGRKGLSRSMAYQIARRIEFTPDETENFVDLVLSEHSRSQRERNDALRRIQKRTKEIQYVKVTDEISDIFSDWRYLAILEFIEIEGAALEPAVIARRLQWDLTSVHAAFDRLATARLISMRDGAWIRDSRFIKLQSSIPSALLRRFHKSMLARASDAIEKQPVNNRKALSMVLSINRDDLQEARQFLDQMTALFMQKFANVPAPNSVYGLSLHLSEIGDS